MSDKKIVFFCVNHEEPKELQLKGHYSDIF